MKKSYLIAICSVVFVVSPIYNAYATSAAADFLVEIGKAHMDAGETDRAIHELSKALLVNPNHVQAKKYLAQLGVNNGLYKGMKMRLSSGALAENNNVQTPVPVAQIANDSKQSSSVDQKMMQLEQQNKDLQAKLIALQNEKKTIADSVMAKEQTVEELKTKINSINQETAKNMNQKENQIQFLKNAKSENTYDLVQAQNELKDLRQRYDQLAKESSEWEDQMKTLSQQYLEKKQEADEYKLAHNDMVQKMEDYLYVRKNEVNSLGDQVVTKEIDLARTQNTLSTKMDQLVRLDDETRRLRQEVNEQNQLIDEKNKDIEYLQNQ